MGSDSTPPHPQTAQSQPLSNLQTPVQSTDTCPIYRLLSNLESPESEERLASDSHTNPPLPYLISRSVTMSFITFYGFTVNGMPLSAKCSYGLMFKYLNVMMYGKCRVCMMYDVILCFCQRLIVVVPKGVMHVCMVCFHCEFTRVPVCILSELI